MTNNKSAMRPMNSSKNNPNSEKAGFISNVKRTLSYLLFLYVSRELRTRMDGGCL